MEFVLELGLGTFGARTDRFGIVAVKCSRGLGVIAGRISVEGQKLQGNRM